MSVAMIDWEKIHTADDLFKTIDNAELFDNSSVEQHGLIINPTLTRERKNLAEFLQQFAEGIIIITGDPGQGKSLLMYVLSWYFRYFFNLMPIFDKRPRP